MRLENEHGSISVTCPATGVVLVEFSGQDVGQFDTAPFVLLDKQLAQRGKNALFIDARQARAASIDVSGAWAQYLAKNKDRFTCVSMLTGSKFIQLSAEFVKRFAEMGDLMRLYTEPAAFDEALREATS